MACPSSRTSPQSWAAPARQSPSSNEPGLDGSFGDPVGDVESSGTIPEGIEAQTDQALVNLAAVLGAAGASVADVVKRTIFYADVEDFARLNEVYARQMLDPAPARSAPAHVRLPHGLLVSTEAIAELPSE